MALGVAFVPDAPKNDQEVFSLIPHYFSWLKGLHYLFAAVLFGSFALLAINVFTIGQNKSESIPVSTFNENHIYRFCGFVILVVIILVPISAKFELFNYSTLILEALALFFFGTAWLIKGRALGDESAASQRLTAKTRPIEMSARRSRRAGSRNRLISPRSTLWRCCRWRFRSWR